MGRKESNQTKQITEDMKGYINSKYSIWIGCFFFKGQVYDWGWFQNTAWHTHTKITPKATPLDSIFYV